MIKMDTNENIIELGNFEIEVIKKDIKNLHISVHPPHGKVRVAAPLILSDESIKTAILSRFKWIRKHQKNFETAARQSKRQYISGESIYFLGKRYLLKVEKTDEKPSVLIKNKKYIVLSVNDIKSVEYKTKVMNNWYREELKKELDKIIPKYEKKLGVDLSKYTIRKMKTKWGSCNPNKKAITLNLELAKKPIKSTEYIVCHELIHFFELHHNDKFNRYMEKYIPNWRTIRYELNRFPLSDEEW